MTIKGTAGDDTLTGTAGNDVFNLTQGGEDNASGLGGDDQFLFGATFDAGDTVDGGDGNDTVKLDGDYSAGLTLGATTLTSVERLLFTGGNSYNITTNDANVAAGATLTLDFGHMHSGDTVTFDGSAETDGNFDFIAGAGHFAITGGAGTNTYNFGATFNQQDSIGGPAGSFNNLILSGDYANLVFQHSALAGLQQITLLDGHSYAITISATVSSQVGSSLFFIDGHRLTGDNHFSLLDKDPGASIEASGGDGADTLQCTASGGNTLSGGNGNDFIIATGFSDVLYGGAGNDLFQIGDGSQYEIHAGSGDDQISVGAMSANSYIDGGAGNNSVAFFGTTGGTLGANSLLHIQTFSMGGEGGVTTVDANVAAGATLVVTVDGLGGFNGSAETDGHFFFYGQSHSTNMTGGALSDTFDYFGHTDAGRDFDTLNAFDFSNDIIEDKTITGIDAAVTTGTLSTGTFNKDMAAAISADLEAHHAILFTPDAGNLAGHMFLIVDGNGVAGWQPATDLVVQLGNALNLGDISTANFISA